MDSQTAQQNALAIAVIETEMKYMKASMEEMIAEVKAMRSQLDQAKGGWRTLMLVGGAAGTIGGAIAWLISHWKL